MRLDGDCVKENIKRKELFHQALKNFDKLKKMKYKDKLIYSEELIKSTIKKFGDDICVSCSFGKDSTLILHLIRKFKPNVKVIFANTGVEYPQTIKFRDFLVKEWDLNYFEVKPIKSFWQCVREYGYPQMRYWSKTAKKKGITNFGTPKCCEYCKEKPILEFYKEHQIQACFLGINWDESYQRKFLIIRHKDCYYAKSDKIWKILPIAYWKTKEVWRFTKEKNLPVNKIYKITDRNGCVPCTGHLKWQERLRKINPKMLRFILSDAKSWQKQMVKTQKFIGI